MNSRRKRLSGKPFMVNLQYTKHARRRARMRDIRIPEALLLTDLPTDAAYTTCLPYSKNYNLHIVLGKKFDVPGNSAIVVTVYKKRKSPKAKWRNRRFNKKKKKNQNQLLT
jgi:hypothetical protein